MRITESLLPPGSRVLCAVSGGSDSVALLHLLWTRREALGIEVFAAHYEHGIRGAASWEDARFVADFCRARGIACTVEHGDVPAYAKAKGMGTEEAARVLRYAFLERTADALGCDFIATAHNADDNAETMLLNLARGSGLKGLCGIPPRRGRIVRPLLETTRAEIEDYLKENALPHREDLSNGDERYRRNLLRSRVTPVLRQLNPAFPRAASGAAHLLRQDEDCLDALASAFLAEHCEDDSLPVGALLALHPAIASRVVRKVCKCSLGSGHVEDVLSFCRGEGLGWLDVPGQRLRRERGRLYFAEAAPVSIPDRVLRVGESLDVPEAGLRITAELIEYNQNVHSLFKTSCLNYEKIGPHELLVTGRKPGDRLRPAHRGCTKSLKALFAEAGYTQAERAATPIIRDSKGILAVYGLAVDERAVPAPGDRVLRLRFENLEEAT